MSLNLSKFSLNPMLHSAANSSQISIINVLPLPLVRSKNPFGCLLYGPNGMVLAARFICVMGASGTTLSAILVESLLFLRRSSGQAVCTPDHDRRSAPPAAGILSSFNCNDTSALNRPFSSYLGPKYTNTLLCVNLFFSLQQSYI